MSNGLCEPSSAKNLSLIIIPRGSSTANIGGGMRMRMSMILQENPCPKNKNPGMLESIFEGFMSYECEKAGEAVAQVSKEL